MEIPKIIKETLAKEGRNRVEYITTRNGEEIYAAGSVDKNGFPIPMGLPVLFVLKDGKVRVVSGEDGLNLFNSL